MHLIPTNALAKQPCPYLMFPLKSQTGDGDSFMCGLWFSFYLCGFAPMDVMVQGHL